MRLKRHIRFGVVIAMMLFRGSADTQYMLCDKFKGTHIRIFRGPALLVHGGHIIQHRKISHRKAEGAEGIKAQEEKIDCFFHDATKTAVG